MIIVIYHHDIIKKQERVKKKNHELPHFVFHTLYYILQALNCLNYIVNREAELIEKL